MLFTKKVISFRTIYEFVRHRWAAVFLNLLKITDIFFKKNFFENYNYLLFLFTKKNVSNVEFRFLNFRLIAVA